MHRITGARHVIQTDDQHGRGRAGFFDQAPRRVVHRADLAVGAAREDHVPAIQRAVGDEHRGHRTAAAVEFGFDHGAAHGLVGIRPQIEHLRLERDGFEQLVDTLTGERRDALVQGIAAPLFGHQPELAQLTLDALRVGVGLVALVDGDHDRHLGRARVIHRFARLGHHAVIGSDDEHHEIRGLRAAHAHRGERFVARRVQERDRAVRRGHRVRADVLGDAARLTGDHVGLADLIEQAGLTVIDVTHDGHYRRTRDALGRVIELGTLRGDQLVFLADGDVFDLPTELVGHDFGRFGVERAVDVHAGHAQAHELHQDLGRLRADLGGQALQPDRLLDAHDLLVSRALLRDDRAGDLALRHRADTARAHATAALRTTAIAAHLRRTARTRATLHGTGCLGIVLNATRHRAARNLHRHGHAGAAFPDVDAGLGRTRGAHCWRHSRESGRSRRAGAHRTGCARLRTRHRRGRRRSGRSRRGRGRLRRSSNRSGSARCSRFGRSGDGRWRGCWSWSRGRSGEPQQPERPRLRAQRSLAGATATGAFSTGAAARGASTTGAGGGGWRRGFYRAFALLHGRRRFGGRRDLTRRLLVVSLRRALLFTHRRRRRGGDRRGMRGSGLLAHDGATL